MHLTDYFPHREMGVGHYLLGEIDAAVRELEGSLSTVESAKAQFFLDKARKEHIDRQGGDTMAPTISVGSLPERTREAAITVKVTAADDGFITSVAIGGDAEVIPIATKSIEIEREISLEEGENEIEITAEDLSSNTAEKKFVVVSDTAGPTVSIGESSMAPGSPARMSIKGWAVDPAGVEAVRLGKLELVPGPDGNFGAVVRVDAKGKVTFEVTDSLGNKTTGVVSVGEEPVQEGRYGESSLAGLFNRHNVQGPLLARWVVETAQAQKKRGPVIKVKGLTSKQSVYFKSFYLEGLAYDPSGVKKLVVGRRSLMNKPARKVYFNYLRRLHRGRNRITIVGKNGLGEASQKRITVIRRVPVVRRVGSRMGLSMLPFHLKGKVNLAEVAHEDLLKYLKKSGRFKMVDRTQIDKVIRELKLSKAGLTSQSSAVRAGKLTAAEVVLLGFVHETPGSIEVYGRLVDVQSGKILAEKDAYTRQKPITLKKLMALMRGLSVKIRNQFPLVQGQLASLQGRNIQAKFKSRAPIKAGTKFIIFRDKIVKHPKTGMPLGNKTVPVTEARISRVSGNTARAVVVNTKGSKKVRKSDKVITK